MTAIRFFNAHIADIGRKQGNRTDKPQFGTKRAKKMDIRSGDTAVGDITANGNFQPFNPANAPANCQRVKQGLGRMFMTAITSIDHRRINMLA